MSTMGTKFRKGRRQRRILALSLVLAIVLAVFSLWTASAASSTEKFNVTVRTDKNLDPSNTDPDNPKPSVTAPHTGGNNTEFYAVDGEIFVSTGDTVNLKTEKIFTLGNTDVSGLKRLEISFTDLTNCTASMDSNSSWKISNGKYTYSSKGGINASEFDRMMNQLQLSFDSKKGARSGKAHITLKGYKGTSGTSSNVLGPNTNGKIQKTVFSCTVNFYDYASGVLNPDTLKVTFENKDKTLTDIEPDNSGMGTATFDMNVTNQGGGQYLQVGYQKKLAGEAWKADTPVEGLELHRFDRQIESGDGPLGTVDADSNDVTNCKPIHMVVTGLEPNTDYDIRGVIVTDGKVSGYRETARTLRVRYTEPTISNYNISSNGDAASIGGDTNTIQATVSFHNSNYNDMENAVKPAEWADYGSEASDSEPETITGPALRVRLLFTENETNNAEEGGEADAGVKDTSTWKVVSGSERFIQLQDGDSVRETLNLNFTHTLPSIDGNQCAYKLEVTDVVTGYTVYAFSDSFIVDSNGPSMPNVSTEGTTDEQLQSGDFSVGGRTGQVELNIGGSLDGSGTGLGSGVREYSYSMFYLSGEYTDTFAADKVPSGTEVNNKSILTAMKGLTADSKSVTEYTDWTSLKRDAETNTSTLTVAKDGYYCIHVRAVDNVEKTSSIKTVIFRVDLTAPNAPDVRLVKEKAGSTVTVTGGQVDGNKFEPYDNSTYSDSKVWLFTRAVPQTGKSIRTDLYEYSVDGGLSWKKISESTNAVSVGGTVEAYVPGQYETKETFAYDVGFQISAEVSGYQSIIVRATDTLLNVSLASNPPAVMRTSETISTSAKFAHESTEIALAMGNTNINVTGLTPDLKNRVALKINQKYYGELKNTSTNNPADANFNPLTLLSTKQANGSWKVHECNWGNDPSCAGACHDANCPYAKTDITMKYTFFTPEMVTVQGLTSSSANDTKVFRWTRYDHSNYADYATVGYVSATKLKANLQPNTTGGYYDKKSGLYTASQDRVIFMRQNQVVTGANKPVDFDSAYGTYFLNVYQSNWGDGDPAGWNSSANYGEDTIDRIGQWKPRTTYGSQIGDVQYERHLSDIYRRIYHMVDMTVSKTESVEGFDYYAYGDNSDPDKLTMSTIYGLGYRQSSYRDWMFLYNDQSTKKEIAFTIDDGQVFAHANDGYGFLFNTTIRQGKTTDPTTGNKEWRISGYMFMIGNPHHDSEINDPSLNFGGEHNNSRYRAKAETLNGYEWYVIKLDDLDLDYFADGTIQKQGVADKAAADAYWENIKATTGAGKNNGTMVKTKDDLIKNLVYYGHNSSNNTVNNYPPLTNPPSSNLDCFKESYTNPETGWNEVYYTNWPLTLTATDYGIYQLANTYPDTTTASIRNYRMVVDNGTMELYLYNSGASNNAASKKDLTALNAEWNKPNHGAYKPVEWRRISDGTLSKGTRQDGKTGDGGTKVQDARVGIYNDAGQRTGWSKSKISTPRPYVDGVQIGTSQAKKQSLHTDTNCYGFGPIVSNRSYWHGCANDSLVVFSNISMTMDTARSLAEVAAQPRWSGVKAKYILNLSDDSSDDFNNPIISANIQWRLTNDQAKFIGWGQYDNKAITDEFVERIQGDGYYQSTETASYDDIAYETQLDKVADYITTQYYEEHDLTPAGGSTASDTLVTNLQAKGAVYELEDAKRLTFSVSPESYNTSTANADYPSGRWYIVHDVTGYPDAHQIARDHQYSDALNLQITEPGRYSIYFAPDKSKVPDEAKGTPDTLDPTDATCVFDFVVNQKPKAQFEGRLNDDNTITILDASYDPDSNKRANETQFTDPATGRQITGVTKTWWRWEILGSKAVTGGSSELAVLAQSGWTANVDYNGKSIRELTTGKVTADGIASGYAVGSGASAFFNQIPANAVLTMYEKVEDVSTLRRRNAAGTGYEYVLPAKGSTSESKVYQQNITSDSNVTFQPNAVLNVTEKVYDTASGSAALATVERKSKQGQKHMNYKLSWELAIGDADYIPLTSTDNGDTWKATVPERNMTTGALTGGKVSKTVLSVVTENGVKQSPSIDSNGDASGKWTVSQDFLKYVLWEPGKSITLKLNETDRGVPVEGLTDDEIAAGITEKDIVGFTSRAITYEKDTKAPAAQTVDVKTHVLSGATWKAQEYEASNYLDMTNADKKVVFTVSGSKDSEGSLAGYGYYFYDKAENGTETKWYYLNPADNAKGKKGALIAAASAKEAVGHVNGGSSNTDYGYLPGGNAVSTIEITAAAMRKVPTDRLNIAIFAFDNQTGIAGSLTGGNESDKTKVEDIKLAKFTPMPPAIKAANTLGQAVSQIGNDAGFSGSGATDTETGTGTANTNVSITFTPRQDWYKLKDDAGKDLPDPVILTDAEKAGKTDDQLTAEGYVKYFVDIHKAADLTNKATIVVTIKDKNGNIYKDYNKKEIDYTQPITVLDSGKYTVSAYVLNGSGSVSETRTISFSIDKQPPTAPTLKFEYNVGTNSGQDYNQGTWARGVSMFISGSKDDDPDAYYMYSSDNGATWSDQFTVEKADGTTEKRRVLITESSSNSAVKFNGTGTYNIRVKAVDTGGSESQIATGTVKIDNEPPKLATPPDLVADETTESVYSEYVISIAKSEGGAVHALNDSGEDALSTEITVKRGSDQKFALKPEAGMEIQEIFYGGTSLSLSDLEASGQLVSSGDMKILTIKDVQYDAVLKVTFAAPVQRGYMAKARMASYNAAAAIRFEAEPENAVAVLSELTYDIYANDDGNGSVYVNGSDSATVEQGSNCTILFVPNSGYEFSGATIAYDDATTKELTEAELTPGDISGTFTYVEENVQQGFTVTGRFTLKVPAVLTVKSEGNGTVTVTGPADGGLNENGDKIYNTFVGESAVLEVTPDTGYMISSLTINGGENLVGDAGMNEYSDTVNITGDTEVSVVFKVATGQSARHVAVYIEPDLTGTVHGTLSPQGTMTTEVDGSRKYVIDVIQGGSQKFLFKPDRACSLTRATLTTGVGDDKNETEISLTEDPATGFYTYTLDNIIDNYNVIRVQFSGNTYAIDKTLKLTDGTTATTDVATVKFWKDGVELSEEELKKVPEGANVTVEILTQSGYRIDKVLLNGVDMGTVRNVDIPAVMADQKLEVTFVKREYNSSRSMHFLTATISNVNDGQDSLPAKPYSFRLDDGEWSEYQSSPTIVYENLLPNHKYTVTVRVIDKVGNVSESTTVLGKNATERYTKANVPIALECYTADEADNVLNKTIKVKIDPNENPAGTKYTVYYSEKKTMPPAGTYDAWLDKDGTITEAEANADGEIAVYRMSEGILYHLQVIAWNGEHVATQANKENILSIRLPPTAPPENSLYFEEQAEPGAPIVLHWDPPTGEVIGFAIYRDGTQIGEAGADETSFTDTDALAADKAYSYSYAYVNQAGTGSRRTAVNEIYHAAAVKANAGNSADKDALDALATKYNAKDAFTETMTYPCAPAGFRRGVVQAVNDRQDSGQMPLTISPNSSSAGRNEKFVVYLKAYRNTGTAANPVYSDPIPDGTPYWEGDPSAPVWNSAATEKETVSLNSTGAQVVWTGLNTEWEYQVFVKEVRSTGWVKTDKDGALTDGYQGDNSIKLETALQKSYKVDRNGYTYSYGIAEVDNLLKPVNDSGVDVRPYAWASENASNNYIGGKDGAGATWDDELVSLDASNGSSYIKFNKSPQISLPKNADNSYNIDAIYDGNQILTYDGEKYIEVDQTSDMKFKLNVRVWDPDGPAGTNQYEVSAALNGKTSNVVKLASLPDSEATAETVTLEFDGKGLGTGVYQDLVLTVKDRPVQKDEKVNGTVKVMVNQSLPSISSSNGGAVKKLQKGYNYGPTSYLKVSSTVSSNNADQLRKVRLIVLEEQNKKEFNNNSSYEGIKAYLQGNDAAAVETAKRLLGDSYNGYLSGGKLTDAGVDAAIDAVPLPMKGYFQVTKEQWDAIADENNKTTTVVSGNNYYWAETEYALANDLCSFLKRDNDDDPANGAKGDIIATGEIGSTYQVLIVTEFGVNQSTTYLKFEMADEPTLAIDSQKEWAWVTATELEYQAYEQETKTIGQVADAFATSFSKRPAEFGFTETDLAYRSTGENAYEVFKLEDTRVNVASQYVYGSVRINTGMYGRFESGHVVLVNGTGEDGSTLAPTDPGVTLPAASETMKVYEILGENGGAVLKDGTGSFQASGLQPGHTYYIWVYYDVIDPETGESKTMHNQDYTAITTNSDWYRSTTGFKVTQASINEAEIVEGGEDPLYDLIRDGDLDRTSVKLNLSIKYYRADQDGVIQMKTDENGQQLLDEDGNPIPDELTGEDLTKAQNTLHLNATELTMGHSIAASRISVHLENTKDMQGHMVAVIQLAIDKENSIGVNDLAKASSELRIFVLDDESPTTSYKFGIDENPGIKAVYDEKTNEYLYDEYKFEGVPLQYGSANITSFSLSLRNAGEDTGIGTGALNHIRAELYDEDRTSTENSDFMLSQQPTTESLQPPDDEFAADARCELQVCVKEGLDDGVHTGWLRITADKVKAEDEIWIHLYQVVGQSTLKGRIYIGNNAPMSDDEYVGGNTTVKIYAGNATSPGAGQEISGEPLYEATVNPYGGSFEIPNILSGDYYKGYYYIVVQRPGFVWYDSLRRQNACRWRPTETGTYEFNLQLRGGDVNGDQLIDNTDYNELVKYLNCTYDPEGDTEMDQKLLRMDYNADGGINALDRMILWNNKNRKIDWLYPPVIPRKVNE